MANIETGSMFFQENKEAHPDLAAFFLPFEMVKERVSLVVQHSISAVRSHLQELRHHIVLVHNDMSATKDKVSLEELNQLTQKNEALNRRLRMGFFWHDPKKKILVELKMDGSL